MHKRSGVALIMVLVVTLVGSMLALTALYLVENLFSTSQATITDTELYNASVSGIEWGKGWIDYWFEEGYFPRWTDPDGDGILASISSASTPPFDNLVATLPVSADGGFQQGLESFGTGKVNVTVVVYDLLYDSTVSFDVGIPPEMRNYEEGSSLRREQSYAKSNQAEGSVGEGAVEHGVGLYLVRSTAKFDDDEDRQTIVDEVVKREY
jgi:hypothetical protein